MPPAGQPGIDFPGVGCGLAIVNDGKLLLCKRLKPPEAGHWSIVGGKVDHMEATDAAARREAFEESSLDIGSVTFLCLSEQVMEADRQHWLSVIYQTTDFAGEPRMTEPDKLSDIGWYDLDALPAPLSRFAQDAVKALKANWTVQDLARTAAAKASATQRAISSESSNASSGMDQ